MYPATLVSVRAKTASGDTIWLIPANIHDLNDKSQDSIAYGSHNIYVDVTPEKRYAVWNHKLQRFQSGPYHIKIDAEHWCEVEIKRFGEARNNFYVVEWEIK